MDRARPVYYHEDPDTIINTMLLLGKERKDMEIAARRVGGVVIESVADEDATAAYTEALQAKAGMTKTPGLLRIEEGVVAAAVSRVLQNGGGVARIVVAGSVGGAEASLRAFEDELVDIRTNRSALKRLAS